MHRTPVYKNLLIYGFNVLIGKKSSQRKVTELIGTVAANLCALFEGSTVVIVAQLSTFLANAHTKEGHVFTVDRPGFQRMKCSQTDMGTLVEHFDDFFRDIVPDFLHVHEQVLTFDPGIKAGIGVEAFNR